MLLPGVEGDCLFQPICGTVKLLWPGEGKEAFGI